MYVPVNPTTSDAPTLQQLGLSAEAAQALVEGCLAAADTPEGQGAATFVSIDHAGSLARAKEIDSLRAAGEDIPFTAGIPFALKDLFDVAGEVTRAGSRTREDASPADVHAEVIDQLDDAGMVPIGRATMVEFAFGGIGTNPNFGTPLSVYDRAHGRVPGGSSSGSAVAVADGMAAVALGTDTGGSCRIPAAYNGLVGFKPTSARVSTEGVFPLSSSLDSVGPIGRTVGCCAMIDRLISWEEALDPVTPVAPARPRRTRLGVLQNIVLEGMDKTVADAYEVALSRLSQAGFTLVDADIDAIGKIPAHYANGGIVGAEAFALHRAQLATQRDQFDPRVASRIELGADTDLPTYLDTLRARAAIKEAATAAVVEREIDALVLPTVAIVPPLLSEVAADDDYRRLNMLSLRNTLLANFLDWPAISQPMTPHGSAPAGLMLFGQYGDDET
ncbi:MAG: amidase, partial [Planctomycetota bacterium]